MKESTAYNIGATVGVVMFLGGFVLAGNYDNSWWLMVSLWSAPVGGLIYTFLRWPDENQ